MYTLIYFTFIFVLYCLLGWILEEVYCFIKTKRFKEDGFLGGPFKPMYGFAILILVYFSEFTYISNLSMWILCLVVPTTVEFISGYILKKIYNKDYWSYSGEKHNLKGFICLKFSLYWFLLCLFIVYVLQPYILNIFINNFNLIYNVTPLIIIYIISDLIVSNEHLKYKLIKA